MQDARGVVCSIRSEGAHMALYPWQRQTHGPLSISIATIPEEGKEGAGHPPTQPSFPAVPSSSQAKGVAPYGSVRTNRQACGGDRLILPYGSVRTNRQACGGDRLILPAFNLSGIARPQGPRPQGPSKAPVRAAVGRSSCRVSNDALPFLAWRGPASARLAESSRGYIFGSGVLGSTASAARPFRAAQWVG
jgi:hypothetical protein